MLKCLDDAEKQSIYDRKIGSIEPFIESVPPVIILTASWFSAWGTLTGNLDEIIAMEQITSTEHEQERLYQDYLDIPTVFYLSFGVSCVSAAWGVTMFYKKGPMRVHPTDGLISLEVLLALLGTWRI